LGKSGENSNSRNSRDNSKEERKYREARNPGPKHTKAIKIERKNMAWWRQKDDEKDSSGDKDIVRGGKDIER